MDRGAKPTPTPENVCAPGGNWGLQVVSRAYSGCGGAGSPHDRMTATADIGRWAPFSTPTPGRSPPCTHPARITPAQHAHTHTHTGRPPARGAQNRTCTAARAANKASGSRGPRIHRTGAAVAPRRASSFARAAVRTNDDAMRKGFSVSHRVDAEFAINPLYGRIAAARRVGRNAAATR